MRNICLVIEYDGTNYCGWQIQKPHVKTIQDTIRRILEQILQEKILLIGASRTDSGVHAKGQTANFKTHSDIKLNKLKEALNSLLPDDIAIKRIKEVPLSFHSQFKAKSKAYRYTILNHRIPPVFLRNYVWNLQYPLNLNLMRQETRVLLGKHDFSAFQGSNRIAKSAVRVIKDIKISKKGSLINIDVIANGFLYNMVRNIVGTLVEIGRGRFSKGSMKKILLSRNRNNAGPTAPGKGLCLMRVEY